MKKAILVAMVAFAVVGGVVGCGGSSSTGGVKSTGSK